jgi:hypothetical protein
MTVCIAAIAAKSKAIICIADRALTFAGVGANAESDSGVTKIMDIPGTRWCAMFSGDDLSFPERVLGLVASDMATLGKHDICDRHRMESSVRKAFEICWNLEVEEHVLKPNLLSISSFTERSVNLQPLDSKFVAAIAEAIADYKHNCSMLFCGFDSSGPHILMANTPCQIDPCDWQGFQAIGAGEETARNHLIWSDFEKDDPLDSALYDVFNAKVATEVLQGVGYLWDWRVIVKDGKPRPLPDKIDRLIDRVWATYNRSPYSPKLSKSEAAPPDWKKRLSDFTSRLLPNAKKTAPRKSKNMK